MLFQPSQPSFVAPFTTHPPTRRIYSCPICFTFWTSRASPPHTLQSPLSHLHKHPTHPLNYTHTLNFLNPPSKHILSTTSINPLNPPSSHPLPPAHTSYLQLPDLLHILDDSGFPSTTNRYLFNGESTKK